MQIHLEVQPLLIPTHKTVVRVTDKPPRPALLSLGITYRRIPVMSIGNDVFFDTSLMIAELERRFTPEIGHPSIMCAHYLR